MPEHLECEVLQKVCYINTLTFTFTCLFIGSSVAIDCSSHTAAAPRVLQMFPVPENLHPPPIKFMLEVGLTCGADKCQLVINRLYSSPVYLLKRCSV